MSSYCELINCDCKYSEERHCNFPIQGSGYPYDAPCFGYKKEDDEGEWIEIADDDFAPIVVCSRCSQTAIVSYGEYQRTRYCPNCGFKMKNGGDEKR
jgi:hypothetical protein